MLEDMEARWRYQQALWKLSELVMRRNHSLLRLHTVSALPLGLTPMTGMLAQFDSHAARQLLDEIDHRTSQINDALAEANHCGALCGIMAIQWRPAPLFRGEGD
jgi:hypothetical protein